MSFLKYSLNYQPDSTQLFERLRLQPWAIWLDSGQPNGQYGRYDILVADPFITITSRETCSTQFTNAYTEIMQDGKLSLSD